MTKKEKMKKHVRLAKKHIKEIEKLGFEVAVGHNELAVFDYSKAPSVEDRNMRFNPCDYIIETIS